MVFVFDFEDYREFLKAALPTDGAQRGARNRLAQTLNCQKGFISQVLSGRSHFSLEHGAAISKFLQLSQQEDEYFLLLLHKDRAGSKDLQSFYQRRLQQILSSRKEIQERVQAKNRLSEVEQTTYFSSWLFSAVHMCLMIPDLQEISQISRYLGISVGSARRVLDFLVEHGLAEYKGDRVIAGPARIHLSRTSPLVAKHHTNWRMRAIESLDEPKPSDMHYSLVMSASPEAAEKIRDILLDAIQKAEPVLKATQDEGIYVLNMDLFGVKKD